MKCNTLIFFVDLAVIALFLFGSAESTDVEKTPVELYRGGDYINGFKIYGCYEKWCQMKEQRIYKIEMNVTVPFDTENPTIEYNLAAIVDGKIRVNGDLPRFCDSLGENTKCPLKAGQHVTYTAYFRMVIPSILFSLMDNKRMSLFIYLVFEGKPRSNLWYDKDWTSSVAIVNLRLDGCIWGRLC